MMLRSWLMIYDWKKRDLSHENQHFWEARETALMKTHASKQDLLKPIPAIAIGTREEVDVVCRVLEEVQVIGGLDGEDE